ncbi:helix-turn-helix domain-containing protein [Brevibacillus ginsengisoli]|uniref:helix-turn-helix domain-containing protein n=1 Tax=Brevibacillus ginsengisoli TaxID=363854 RepID=UPI003CF85A3D
MNNIRLLVHEPIQQETLQSWITEYFADRHSHPSLGQTSLHSPFQGSTMMFVEVNHSFDWVTIYRLQKKQPDLRMILLIDRSQLHMIQLICRLRLDFFLIKPLKKHIFLNMLKRILASSDKEESYKSAYVRESFLRRLLGESINENELQAASKLFPDRRFPNIVYFLQGFIKDQPDDEIERAALAPALIQSTLEEKLAPLIKPLYFLPFHKHLLFLSRVPYCYPSLRDWEELTSALLEAIEQLKRDYDIHIYIGVGSVTEDPSSLYKSYLQARKARHTPPSRTMSLRFFEEISQDVCIQKCISYISHHYNEDLSIATVADQVNLSYTYFSRLFKRETGMSFVEYVTFVRLQRAVWMLRHSNKTIEVIAEDNGFNTPNYFSSIFRKNVLMSPSEYRATREIFFL